LRLLRPLLVVAGVVTVVALAFAVWTAVDLSRRIQSQRRDAILSACRDQNTRHDALKKYIDALVARPQPGQRRLPKKVREREAAGFVNAIAPHRRCSRVAARSTK
jgi:hypothetical protein